MKQLLSLAAVLVLLVGVTATWGQSSGSGTLTVSWTAPTTYATGTPLPPSAVSGMTYNVYLGSAGKGSEGNTPAATGVAALSYQSTGYAPGATVCAEVTAVLNGLESARSGEACATFPTAAPAVPAVPTNVTVTAQ